jgi:hypothetical protein
MPVKNISCTDIYFLSTKCIYVVAAVPVGK